MTVVGDSELKMLLTVILSIDKEIIIKLMSNFYNSLQYNQQMRGVRINNYIDNRIMLSGRKIKNQVETVIQSHRPKPLIVNHLNQIEHEEEIITEQKSPKVQLDLTSNKKRKKRTKTIAVNNQNQGQNLQPKTTKNRVSLSLQQLKKGMTSGKKKSNQSSPSKDSQVNPLAQTQKKLKPVYKSPSQGLGKRSKSAIIKNTKITEKDKEKMNRIIEEEKKKKEKKKGREKEKEKRKTLENRKEKEKKNNSINEIKKAPSSMNLSTKSRKKVKSTEKKKKLSIKSTFTSAQQSKLVSARDKRSNISKKLFQNKKDEIPLEVIKYKREEKKIRQKQEREGNNKNVKKIMNQLQNLLSTSNNDEKLKKKLAKITAKIQNLAQNSESSSQEEDSENHLGRIAQYQDKLLDDLESDKTEKLYDEEDQIDDHEEEYHLSNEKIEGSGEQVILLEMNKQISKIQHKKSEKSEEGERTDEIDIDNHIIITESKKQDFPEEKEEKPSQSDRDSEEEDIQETFERNPILGRRGVNNEVDLQLQVEYDSIKSHDDRKTQIQKLKRFKEESNRMMEKIKEKKEEKSDLEKVKSPRNSEMYGFEKYPKINDVKSPKVNQQQIEDIINLKQRVVNESHNKLSELVSVMYDKKVVSPKTYEVQLNLIKKKKEEENQMLESYKKHAEELAKLLTDIKKQKEQINGIDELIRGEKWNQAMLLVEKNKNNDNQKSLNKESNKSHESEVSSENSDPIYYSGDHSEEGQPTIKLQPIPVEPYESHEPHDESIIKIDENEGEKKRKGFESNLYFIKQYCIALCQFVRDRFGDQFKESIGKPLEFELEELLKSYRTLKNGESAEKLNSIYEDLQYHKNFRSSSTAPIHKQIFEEFNQNYENIKYYGKEESRDAELEGIFLNSIYNALNQSLNSERPGGLSGKALPWAHSSKHLKNHKNKVQSKQRKKRQNQNADSEDLIFGIAIARIIQWGSCLCGFIPDTAELENTQIDEEYVNHIRETRMALLLQKMLAEEEHEMTENELEETEVKLSIAKIVFEDIVREEAEEIKKISKKSIIREIDY